MVGVEREVDNFRVIRDREGHRFYIRVVIFFVV